MIIIVHCIGGVCHLTNGNCACPHLPRQASGQDIALVRAVWAGVVATQRPITCTNHRIQPERYAKLGHKTIDKIKISIIILYMKGHIDIIYKVIEKLLFPLHKKVYVEINKIVEMCILEYPNFIEEMFSNYSLGYKENTKFGISINKEQFYKLDIAINYCLNKYSLKDIEKISNPIIEIKDMGFKTPSEYDGNSFVINIYCIEELYSFSVALEYVLGFEKENVLKQNNYQLYCHTIVPKKLLNELVETKNNSQEYINNNSFKYIGYTKRSWQTRYKEHLRSSKKGSNKLFQRALRGEICEIGMIEHCIERCGLDKQDAIRLETQEIENRSLNSKNKMGLNMISGREYGYRFLYKLKNKVGI
jgi:hypothetical protein